MEFASLEQIIFGAISFAIVLALFYLCNYFAKRYDKKHPKAKRISGHYMTPKAGYSFSKGEHIFTIIYFCVVLPILIIVIAFIWDKLFN